MYFSEVPVLPCKCSGNSVLPDSRYAIREVHPPDSDTSSSCSTKASSSRSSQSAYTLLTWLSRNMLPWNSLQTGTGVVHNKSVHRRSCPHPVLPSAPAPRKEYNHSLQEYDRHLKCHNSPDLNPYCRSVSAKGSALRRRVCEKSTRAPCGAGFLTVCHLPRHCLSCRISFSSTISSSSISAPLQYDCILFIHYSTLLLPFSTYPKCFRSV